MKFLFYDTAKLTRDVPTTASSVYGLGPLYEAHVERSHRTGFRVSTRNGRNTHVMEIQIAADLMHLCSTERTVQGI